MLGSLKGLDVGFDSIGSRNVMFREHAVRYSRVRGRLVGTEVAIP